MLQYLALFTATAAWEYAYVRYAKAAAGDGIVAPTVWGVIMAALGLVGLSSAMSSAVGAVVYLCAVAAGTSISAALHKRSTAALKPPE